MASQIYLIGKVTEKFGGNKLPITKEVMSVFFYHHISGSLTIKESASITADKILDIWRQMDLPTRERRSIIKTIISFHYRWTKLHKNKNNKQSLKKKKNESIFCLELNKLFDIAHHNAMNIIDSDKKLFLLGQRSSNRRVYIHNTVSDIVQTDQDISVSEEKQDIYDEIAFTQSIIEHANDINLTSQLPTEQHLTQISKLSDESHFSQTSRAISNFEDEIRTLQQKQKINVITPELASALDRANVSSRDATYIIAATLSSVGIDIQNVNLSYQTIHRARMKFRAKFAHQLKDSLMAQNHYILHWDGKMLEDLTGTNYVDRLPILISASGEEQLLSVPKLQAGTGECQASAIITALDQWGLSDNIIAMCFDTTAVNTGIKNGTCTIIEKQLNRELIYLPCRHHIFEIIFRSVFEIYWPTQSGPNVKLFLRFKDNWDKIDQSKYKSGVSDKIISHNLDDVKDEIQTLIDNYLQNTQPRDDYRELLELSSIFLGGNFKFKRPGAIHHARWMSKSIYCLKIFLFRDQFDLTKREVTGLRHICMFTIRFYIKAWFSATSAIKAPNHDLNLIQKLLSYSNDNASISLTASRKLTNHLWYLTDELAVLSLFDMNVSMEVKKKMICAIKTRKNSVTNSKRFIIENKKLKLLIKKDISDFVSNKSLNLFKKFGLATDFLDEDISSWPLNESFKKNVDCFNKLNVVNDVAERGVSLIKEYNKCLTKDENQLQFLLQVVKSHQQKYPNCNKSRFV